MNTRSSSLIGLVGCIACAGVHAQISEFRQESRVITTQSIEVESQRNEPSPSARGNVTSPVPTPVDSVAGDLQTIVVLCATQPQSEAFKTEWATYIDKHDVTAESLDALIDEVLERAEAYRARRASSPRASRAMSVRATTRSMMHDTAMAVIRKIG